MIYCVVDRCIAVWLYFVPYCCHDHVHILWQPSNNVRERKCLATRTPWFRVCNMTDRCRGPSSSEGHLLMDWTSEKRGVCIILHTGQISRHRVRGVGDVNKAQLKYSSGPSWSEHRAQLSPQYTSEQIPNPQSPINTMGFTASVQFLFAATICLLVVLSSATEYPYVNLGLAKENLNDTEFYFSFKKDSRIADKGDGIRRETLIPDDHQLLRMPDVDVSFVRVIQQQGHVIPWHVHPRASEHYATITGLLQVSLTLEGTRAPRHVVNKLPPGHVGVIPQAIPHSVTCLSTTPCVYHVFFPKGDSGFAFFSTEPGKIL